MCDGFPIGEAGTRSVGTNYSYDSNPNKSEEPKKNKLGLFHNFLVPTFPLDQSVFPGRGNNQVSGIMNG